MSEKDLELQFRAHLKSLGWYTIKMHGGIFQARLPDLYCMHPRYGTRWVELKTPIGKLSQAQITEFTRWWKYGVKVFILTSVSDYPKLFGPSNLQTFIDLQEY